MNYLISRGASGTRQLMRSLRSRRFFFEPQAKIAVHGLTLIELLIVIALVALVSACLLPVLATVREKARGSTCASNERQISGAIIQYCADYDERYPPVYSSYDPVFGYGGSDQYWPQLISPFIQKTTGTGLNGQATLSNLSGIFQCPDQQFPNSHQNLGNWSSYGINDSIVNWWAPDPVPTTYRAVTMAEVAAPGSAILLAEAKPNRYETGLFVANIFDDFDGVHNGVWGFVDARHLASAVKPGFLVDTDGFNSCAFCDGHVKLMRWSRLHSDPTVWSISGTGLWP